MNLPLPLLRRRAVLSHLAAWALLGLSMPTLAQTASAFDHRYAAWDALLKKHVYWLPGQKQSRVAYAGFMADAAALRQVTDMLSAVPQAEFNDFSRPQQMAFLINAYNAFTVALILTEYPKLKSIKDLGSLLKSAWKRPFFMLLGEQRHLDWIEHEQLRPNYADPRIHMAVNCASIGCPALPPEAFIAEKLNAQLEDGMRRFLGDATRNRLQNGKLEVSQIFKWFREDFEKGHQGFSALPDVFARYAVQLATAPEGQAALRGKAVAINYLDYDWALNDLGR